MNVQKKDRAVFDNTKRMVDEIRQNEREKVLDEVENVFKEMGCYSDMCCLEYFKQRVKVIRQENK